MEKNRDELKKQMQKNEGTIAIYEKVNKELNDLREIVSKCSKGIETNKLLEETDIIINEGKRRIEQITTENKKIINEIRNIDDKEEFKDNNNNI